MGCPSQAVGLEMERTDVELCGRLDVNPESPGTLGTTQGEGGFAAPSVRSSRGRDLRKWYTPRNTSHSYVAGSRFSIATRRSAMASGLLLQTLSRTTAAPATSTKRPPGNGGFILSMMTDDVRLLRSTHARMRRCLCCTLPSRPGRTLYE